MKAIQALVLIGAAMLAGAAQAAERGFVWQISDDDNTVFLAGSMHLLPPHAYPLPPAYGQAYEKAEILAFETDIAALRGSEAQTLLFRAARFPAGEGLEDHLDADLYAQLAAVVDDLGLSMSGLRSFRPWFVAGMLEMQAFLADDYRQNLGLDYHFYAQAKEDGKAILPLETLEEHLAVLTEMPAATGKAYLEATVSHAEDLEEAASDFYDLWRAGDARGMAAFIRAQLAANPGLYERLLFARNRAWLNDIEALLNGERDAMVVVGALHLVGERGLLELLRARGYQVRH